MNHGVSEKHKIHASASDALVILLQVHLQSLFKPFERWNLRKKKKRCKQNEARLILPDCNTKKGT